MQSDRIIVFSHIPKTAGTSLTHLLRRHFGTSQLDAKFRSNADRAAYFPKDLRNDMLLYPNVRLISGHCMKPFVHFDEFSDRMDWVTFLRDPVKRFVSHYVHRQTELDVRDRTDLLTWHREKKRPNWMVEMLAGEQNVEKAKEILSSKFKFVGHTEEFERSLEMMKVALRLWGFDTKLNAPKMVMRDTSIKDEVYANFSKYEDLILSSNELDIELYDFFKREIWPNQCRLLLKAPSTPETAPVNHGRNLLLGKLKRNALYKPFVSVQELLSMSKIN